MVLTDDMIPLTLAGQYIAQGNIADIRITLFDHRSGSPVEVWMKVGDGRGVVASMSQCREPDKACPTSRIPQAPPVPQGYALQRGAERAVRSSRQVSRENQHCTILAANSGSQQGLDP